MILSVRQPYAKCMAPFSYPIYPINGNYLLPDCVFACIVIAATAEYPLQVKLPGRKTLNSAMQGCSHENEYC